jgi:hypothetical protein
LLKFSKLKILLADIVLFFIVKMEEK